MEYSCKDDNICDCLCPNTDCIHNPKYKSKYKEKDGFNNEQHNNN